MKELSIEGKAKRYDEALERATKWYDANTNEGYRGIFEDIFPELKESEDESIRKGLIKFVSAVIRGNDDAELSGILAKDCLAWLEKQGEQKPVIEMKTLEESLGIDSDTYNKIVDECIYGEQKSAWSEEDEAWLNDIICDAEQEVLLDTEQIKWLKSLKDRVQLKQKKL